jgi:hypothetical protein
MTNRFKKLDALTKECLRKAYTPMGKKSFEERMADFDKEAAEARLRPVDEEERPLYAEDGEYHHNMEGRGGFHLEGPEDLSEDSLHLAAARDFRRLYLGYRPGADPAELPKLREKPRAYDPETPTTTYTVSEGH